MTTESPKSYYVLHDQVQRFFGDRAGLSYVNSSDDSTTALLYESVILTCSIDEETGVFTASLRGGLDELLTLDGEPDPTGVTVSDTAAGSAAIDQALGTIDTWARALLPAKYLLKYDEVITSGARWRAQPMTGVKLSFEEVADLAIEFWGRQLEVTSRGEQYETLKGTLYGVFTFTAGLDRYGTFGAGIIVNDEMAVGHYLGFDVSLNNDHNTVQTAFEMIDEYCRLRLPDSYLNKQKKRRWR